jgi:hypothetical protein
LLFICSGTVYLICSGNVYLDHSQCNQTTSMKSIYFNGQLCWRSLLDVYVSGMPTTWTPDTAWYPNMCYQITSCQAAHNPVTAAPPPHPPHLLPPGLCVCQGTTTISHWSSAVTAYRQPVWTTYARASLWRTQRHTPVYRAGTTPTTASTTWSLFRWGVLSALVMQP